MKKTSIDRVLSLAIAKVVDLWLERLTAAWIIWAIAIASVLLVITCAFCLK